MATSSYRNDVAFWNARLSSLPQPPSLPRLPEVANNAMSTQTEEHQAHPFRSFRHLAGSLDLSEWKRLRHLCARNGLTPTAALAAVYAHALAAWTSSVGNSAQQTNVLINVMHTMRLPVHADISKVSYRTLLLTLLITMLLPILMLLLLLLLLLSCCR